MPAVFSPGEVETRPLHPEEIVYTNAQKVADLLGVGPGEAVLVGADSATDGVFVTGNDFREHGFSAGDTIFVYSDDDPLGFEKKISAPTSHTTGVKLPFESGTVTAATYTVAKNTYVQNTASFTAKRRGVTKAHVEQRIKEVQDRIDNYTHNAWRPYIVAAEYINFDTYKPYRRRYFTDYVGTAPLLFRNVQQVLRIEMWQGENYREIGSAEARLEIVDYTALASDAVYMSPGGGGFAKLAVGTGTQQWDATFDKVTAAQNLADLINHEDRTGRGTVAFDTTASFASPDGTTFTLPDASTSTGSRSMFVNHEFLATANSDYGNGKLKITSMRQTKGGESASIAVSDSTNLAISQTTSVEASGTIDATPGAGAFTITFTDSSSFLDYGIVRGVNPEGGVCIIGYRANSGTVLSQGILLHGTFSDDDTFDWTQHKFQSDIGAFSDAGGDQGRLKDWWLDHEMGIIYFNNSYPFFEFNAIKASYIYGERYLEKAIEEAATKLVAVDLIMADDRSVLIPEGSQNITLAQKAEMWKKEANSILTRYKEVVVFE
jgi:hypothetical protein